MSALPLRSLYVYYRVPAGGHAEAEATVRDMHAALRATFPGLVTRLMCRADRPADAADATWMEIYEHPDGVSAACESALMAMADERARSLPGPRHVEIFCPVAPEAVGRNDHP